MNTRACMHESTARWPLLVAKAVYKDPSYEVLEWCCDCGATRSLTFELKEEDRSSELKGASDWQAPRLGTQGTHGTHGGLPSN